VVVPDDVVVVDVVVVVLVVVLVLVVGGTLLDDGAVVGVSRAENTTVTVALSPCGVMVQSVPLVELQPVHRPKVKPLAGSACRVTEAFRVTATEQVLEQLSPPLTVPDPLNETVSWLSVAADGALDVGVLGAGSAGAAEVVPAPIGTAAELWPPRDCR
jgi:hypothetical protein